MGKSWKFSNYDAYSVHFWSVADLKKGEGVISKEQKYKYIHVHVLIFFSSNPLDC